MSPAAPAFGHEVAFLDKFLQAQLHGAGFAAGEAHDLAEGEGLVVGEEGEDFPGQRVQVDGRGVFEGNLPGEGVLLLREGAEEEEEPGFPVGILGTEGGLGAAEGAVVALTDLADSLADFG